MKSPWRWALAALLLVGCEVTTNLGGRLLEDGGLPSSCGNGEKDGLETDRDCGGGVCARCGTGRDCDEARDCESGLCPWATCLACLPDGYRNGFESDVDCGAACEVRCDDEQRCLTPDDCLPGRECFEEKCRDINECLTDNGGCDPHAGCLNTGG